MNVADETLVKTSVSLLDGFEASKRGRNAVLKSFFKTDNETE